MEGHAASPWTILNLDGPQQLSVFSPDIRQIEPVWEDELCRFGTSRIRWLPLSLLTSDPMIRGGTAPKECSSYSNLCEVIYVGEKR